MKKPGLTLRQWVGITGFVLVFILVAAVAVWRGDILKAGLDPQVPFQTYDPPPVPNYEQASAWVLRDARAPGAGGAHVFFVHSTTYEGGKHWNGPIDDRSAADDLRRGVLPNYAGPFARTGDVSAPRYRQASLYTRLTMREDAREARAFAYRDVDAAFSIWLQSHPTGPIVLVGAEQGADLVDRLLHDRLAHDHALKQRLVAAYLMEGVIPEARFGDVPLCQSRNEVGCALAWRSVEQGDETDAKRVLRRALVWDERGALISAEGAPTACVNPVTGSVNHPVSAMRDSRGATNATNLEWGVRPAFQSRIVAAECRDGILWRSPLNSESFRPRGSWADRRKIPPFNLFYADIEADALTRLAAWKARQTPAV
ncbi:DUF3089 domain-containing protein [Brevundimonas sp. NPDC090276]|uniref:DUF3089 domain-containing protein n=1 Tax=Brevundimonas sp. NPDC090276 TaxID=3363956 RepID=UPI00383AF0B0